MGGIFTGGVLQILLFIVVAPLLGLAGDAFFTYLIFVIFRKVNPYRIKDIFKRLQLVSVAFYSIGHGTNDAQKTMGTKITKIHALEGFCAESSAALVLQLTASAGIPVSTTHVISGSWALGSKVREV